MGNAIIESSDDEEDVEIDANEYNLVVDFDEYGLMSLLIILGLLVLKVLVVICEIILLLIFCVFNLDIVLKNGKTLEHFKESKKRKLELYNREKFKIILILLTTFNKKEHFLSFIFLKKIFFMNR